MSCASLVSHPATSQNETINQAPLTIEEQSDLGDLLKSCDSALRACDKANKDKAEVIKKQDDLIKLQAKQYEELEKSQSGIFNSKGFWFALGSILTVLIFAFIGGK